MPKRRRAKALPVVNKDGIEISSVYCRKCTQTKSPKEFYTATDKFLDTNGYMSVCKECIGEMYTRFYSVEHNMGRAIYKVCQAINIIYVQTAVDGAKKQLDTTGKTEDDPKAFGMYKAKIVTTQKGIGIAKMGEIDYMDLTFHPESSNIPEHNIPEENSFDSFESVVEYWGEGLSPEDYRYLEKELAEWKQSYSCQNKAEEFFLKQVCLKALELEHARAENKGVDSALKSMQELLKNASLTPAQQTAASSGKGVETWGNFIKTIQETTPAEYYKDKTLFKDYDDIGSYFKKYVVRPLRNFVTGSRDFNIIDERDDLLEETNEPTEQGKTEQTLSE